MAETFNTATLPVKQGERLRVELYGGRMDGERRWVHFSEEHNSFPPFVCMMEYDGLYERTAFVRWSDDEQMGGVIYCLRGLFPLLRRAWIGGAS